MNFIESIKARAKENKKTIVLPETMDKRVLQAGIKATQEGIANIIFIGNEESVKKDNPELDFSNIKFIDPATSELTNTFTVDLYHLRKHKGMTNEEAYRLLTEDYMYFACMLVQENMADGVVSGACHSSANTLRPSLQIIKTKPDTELVSAFFLMVVPNCEYGDNGVFIFADSGLVQEPNPEELAAIANSSAKTFTELVGSTPYVAMLSHSTLGSAKHEMVDKVIEATRIAKEKYPELNIDGELQLDAAIVPEVAKSKAPNSNIAGKANVLIFPDLDAGNIGYKLVQRLAKAEAYGPITQGIKKPINDLSRGCSTDDIVGTIAITAVQAE
jgi:phosphate acetyltransferase